MNVASAVVLAAVLSLAALAVWRNLKKGAPCECGSCGKSRSCGCHCGK